MAGGGREGKRRSKVGFPESCSGRSQMPGPVLPWMKAPTSHSCCQVRGFSRVLLKDPGVGCSPR